MDSLKKLTFMNYLLCLIGLVAEFIFANDLKPIEHTVFIFLIIWGSLPIFILLLFLFKTPPIPFSMNLSLIQIFIVIGIGMILKINSIYIHPDPRGAIALATIPIIQIIVALFIGLIIKVVSRKHFRSFENLDDQGNNDEN